MGIIDVRTFFHEPSQHCFAPSSVSTVELQGPPPPVQQVFIPLIISNKPPEHTGTQILLTSS